MTLTNLNLHAWTEVYFQGFGWLPFDATPSQAIGGSVSTRYLPGATNDTDDPTDENLRTAPAPTRAAAPTRDAVSDPGNNPGDTSGTGGRSTAPGGAGRRGRGGPSGPARHRAAAVRPSSAAGPAAPACSPRRRRPGSRPWPARPAPARPGRHGARRGGSRGDLRPTTPGTSWSTRWSTTTADRDAETPGRPSPGSSPRGASTTRPSRASACSARWRSTPGTPATRWRHGAALRGGRRPHGVRRPAPAATRIRAVMLPPSVPRRWRPPRVAQAHGGRPAPRTVG